jgi:Bacterial Ig domain
VTRRLRQLTASCALALVAGGLGAAPADAATGSPPVTANDAASMFAGNVAIVDVLANDSDPDGDDLAICRVAESTYKKLEPVIDGDNLVILTSAGAAPGTYTFTYYACDFSYLTAGTVTITIDPEPEIKVKKLPGKPGKLKVTNPADFRIQFLFGSFREDAPDGDILIKKDSSVVITVHRHKIGWIAFTRQGDFLKVGRVKGISLPPGDQPPAAGKVSPNARMATAWRAQ